MDPKEGWIAVCSESAPGLLWIGCTWPYIHRKTLSRQPIICLNHNFMQKFYSELLPNIPMMSPKSFIGRSVWPLFVMYDLQAVSDKGTWKQHLKEDSPAMSMSHPLLSPNVYFIEPCQTECFPFLPLWVSRIRSSSNTLPNYISSLFPLLRSVQAGACLCLLKHPGQVIPHHVHCSLSGDYLFQFHSLFPQRIYSMRFGHEVQIYPSDYCPLSLQFRWKAGLGKMLIYLD